MNVCAFRFRFIFFYIKTEYIDIFFVLRVLCIVFIDYYYSIVTVFIVVNSRRWQCHITATLHQFFHLLRFIIDSCRSNTISIFIFPQFSEMWKHFVTPRTLALNVTFNIYYVVHGYIFVYSWFAYWELVEGLNVKSTQVTCMVSALALKKVYNVISY